MSIKRIVLAAIFFLTCTISATQQAKEFEPNYNRFKDQLLASTASMKILGGKFDGLHIIASSHQAQQVEWAFPKQGMETKTVNGKTAYKLGQDCYGIRDEYNGRPIAIIFLPANLETLIDNVNASDKNAIPDKTKFLTALAVNVAIVPPEGKVTEYLGSGKFEGDDAYVYKTRNGIKVVAIASKDLRYVVIAVPSQ